MRTQHVDYVVKKVDQIEDIQMKSDT